MSGAVPPQDPAPETGGTEAVEPVRRLAKRRIATRRRPPETGGGTLQRLLRLGDKQQARTVKRLVAGILVLVGLGVLAHFWLSPWLQYRAQLQHLFERGQEWESLANELAQREAYDPDLFSLLVRAAGEHESSLEHHEYLARHLSTASLETVLVVCGSPETVVRHGGLTVLSRLVWAPAGTQHPVVAEAAPAIMQLALEARFDENADIRNIALMILKEFPDTARFVDPLLEDTSPEVRIVAAQTLGGMDDSLAVVGRLEGLLADSDERVRVQALVSLAKYRPELCVGPLAERALQPDSIGRMRCVYALLEANGPTLVGMWKTLATDLEARLRMLAVRGLAPHEGKDAREVLEGLMLDPEFKVRIEAIACLGERGNKAALRAVIARLRGARTLGDKDASFRAVVALAETPVPEAALDNLGSLPIDGSESQNKALRDWLAACEREITSD